MPRAEPIRFSLRQLEVFLAIAAELTTSAAASRLAMSQSAVSAALNTLESSYGVALFDRVGKGLVLNAVGRRLLDQVEGLLQHAREVEGLLSGENHRGDLDLGASFTIANHLVVDYLTQWLDSFPQARVDITSGNSPDIVAQVINRQVELGLIENEVVHADIECIPWLKDELVVFCAPDHPLANKRSLSKSDLHSARWILREPGSGARQKFDQVFADQLTQLQIYLEFGANEPIRRAVEQGLGIGCLSDRVLQPHFENGSLIRLPLASRFGMQRTFYLCLHRRHHRSAAVEGFMGLCLSANQSGSAVLTV